MPRISVILPVYNNEKYIKKCIDSILNQKMQDFELIIINDGSTDSSEIIIEEYVQKNSSKIKYYSKSNSGISDTRNFGIDKATGDYLCFVDSDDYIDENLLKEIEKYMDDNIDIIKYKCIKEDENGKEIERVNGPIFECTTGEEAFDILYGKDILIDVVWLYVYKKELFEKNNIRFAVGRYHEDWAIAPYSIAIADTVVSVDIYGYHYVQSFDSITRDNDSEKVHKRAYDMLYHYDNLMNKLSTVNLRKKTSDNFKIYMSNCLILKLEELPREYRKQYIEEIKKRKIIKNFKCRNFKEFLKKIILKSSIKLYLKIR